MTDEFELELRPRYDSRLRLWLVRVATTLRLGIGGEVFRDVAIRFDTATEVTQIPARILPSRLRTMLASRPRHRFRSATGAGEAPEVEFAFSFDLLPHWAFRSVALVNDQLQYGLLSPRDVLGRFHPTTRGNVDVPVIRDPTAVARVGKLAFRLRPDHDGAHTPATSSPATPA